MKLFVFSRQLNMEETVIDFDKSLILRVPQPSLLNDRSYPLLRCVLTGTKCGNDTRGEREDE